MRCLTRPPEQLEAELETLLEHVFELDTEEYRKRGFKRRVGYGTRPAVIHIHMANAWTRPGHQFSCKNMETIIPACQDLNTADRAGTTIALPGRADGSLARRRPAPFRGRS